METSGPKSLSSNQRAFKLFLEKIENDEGLSNECKAAIFEDVSASGLKGTAALKAYLDQAFVK